MLLRKKYCVSMRVFELILGFIYFLFKGFDGSGNKGQAFGEN